jgi:dolichol-phosphate mannosyltransferase
MLSPGSVAMAPRRLIFVPTYNENRNVERLCAELLALPLTADILFIDDGSPDGTGATLDALARRHPQVSVIHRQGKLGIGSAHAEGIAYAYDRGYDQLVTMDADFSHNPGDIPRLFAALGPGVDAVVGSRYLQSGSLPGWSPYRLFLTRLGHFLTMTLLRLPYDASGALRLYDLRQIPRELFGLVTARAYAFFFESLFVLHCNGVRITEVPIVLPARVYGNSKLTLREGIRSGRFLMKLVTEYSLHRDRYLRARRVDTLRPALSESQGWDQYWTEKPNALGAVYDLVANVYRRVIRYNLRHQAHRAFVPGARLLHAGCGSGQVDQGLHAHYRITAVDISERALSLYARNNRRASRIEQADIFELPFEADAFDGAYNLGVMEHFHRHEIRKILSELHRVLKPGGRLVLFWPHRQGSSVIFLKLVRRVLRGVLGRDPKFHPDEVSLLGSREEAADHLWEAGFALHDYYFGLRDLFVQCVVVAEKLRTPPAAPLPHRSAQTTVA